MSLQTLWVIATIVGVSSGLFFDHHILPRPVETAQSRAAIPLYIEQKLDHFDVLNTATWQQKYWRDDSFFVDGPIFVMIDNADSIPYQIGFVYEMAKQYNARIYSLQGRFYGSQQPTPDVSVASLRFMSTEQALVDIAVFLEEVRALQPTSKVILFGVSNGGALATWARARFPRLVDGAVASSAPLLAQVDFSEYMAALADVLEAADANCVRDIKAATDETFSLLSGPNGTEEITNLFNLCTPLDADNKMDVAVFFRTFANAYATSVRYARSLADVAHACGLATDPQYGATPLERYARLARAFFAVPGGCFDPSYRGYVVELVGDTSWSGQASNGARPFFHQMCTEVGRFHTSTSDLQPFGDHFSSEIFVQACSDIFDSRFNRETLDLGVYQTNLLLGGLKPSVSNVVFTHGSLDPERFMQVTQDLSETATSIRIEGATHGWEMYAPSAEDTAELKAARVKISDAIQQWLSPRLI